MSLLVTMAGLTVVTVKWAEREPFRSVRDKEKRLEEGEKADTIENGVGNKACDISTCAITKKLGFLVKDFFLRTASRGEYDVEVVLETVRRLLKFELDA